MEERRETKREGVGGGQSGEWKKEIKDKDRMRKRKGNRLERWEERVAEVTKDKMKKVGEGGGRVHDSEKNQAHLKVVRKMT